MPGRADRAAAVFFFGRCRSEQLGMRYAKDAVTSIRALDVSTSWEDQRAYPATGSVTTGPRRIARKERPVPLFTMRPVSQTVGVLAMQHRAARPG